VWWARRKEQQRAALFKPRALPPGFRVIDLDEGLIAPFEDSQVLRSAIRHPITCNIGKRPLIIFDYFLLRRYSNTTKSYQQTAAVWPCGSDLPDFTIEPRSLDYRLARTEAHENIEKLWPRGFSKLFYVDSSDIEILERAFPRALFDFFLADPRASCHLRDGRLLYFVRNQIMNPTDLEPMLVRIALLERALEEVEATV
jgi:hypothetical protein